MRAALIAIFVLISFSLSGTTYYVATNGNNNNPGTISQPWATIHKGFNTISAGDILYIRGGTYTPSAAQSVAGVYCAVGINGKNGTSGSKYQVYAYPGESPVLDCSNITGAGRRAGIYINSSAYWYIKGIEIKNLNQTTSGGDDTNAMIFQNCSYCTAEFITAHNIQGAGLKTASSNEILFLNCDSHDNYDPYTNTFPGDNADGFDLGYNSGGIIRCTNCRSWNNSDDGFDLYQASGFSGVYYLTNCWSWHQGYRSDQTIQGGDGNGFKYGADEQSYNGLTQRYTYNCFAYNNRQIGFSQQSANVKMVFYNNISYRNGLQGYEFNYFNCADILKNNISYNNGSGDIFQSNQTRTNNSWQNGLVVSSADFASLDGTELANSRKSDGSLPDINFLHLVTGSDLIDAGVDVGLPFSGKAPDLGPFELQFAQPVTVPAPVPAAGTFVVEDATPSLLIITYDLALNSSIVPAASSYSVTVNSSARTINSVSVSGNKVQLTLSGSIKYGDIVTVSYTKPSNNPLQTISDGEAASFNNRSVTNNCLKPVKANDPPTVNIKNEPESFSGFVGEIDASGSYDINNDNLTYSWTIPNNVPVSSTNTAKINFLSPSVTAFQVYTFQLKVSDGIAEVTKSIPINILPYKPEISAAIITSIEASNYRSSDYPDNINDNNTSTNWSADGDNQWLILKLAGSFKISHLVLSFLQGQRYSSYFDIYVSKDKINWEPVLTIEKSCTFSGDRQVFDFAASDTSMAYSYIKYVGHGNSLNTLNTISEFNVFGKHQPDPNQPAITKTDISIYPNPVTDCINISIGEPKTDKALVRIIDHSGNIVFENVLYPNLKQVKIPVSLKTGFYVVNLLTGNSTFYSQRLIVNN